VLELTEKEKPVPNDEEIRIRIIAANVFPGDCEMRRFDVHPSMWVLVRIALGVFRPRRKILGQELSGRIDAIGKEVTGFKLNDEVFGSTQMKLGGYADYVCLPAKFPFVKKPENITHIDACTLSVGGSNALHFIDKAKLKKNEKILIFGAAGSIGTYAVQLAKLQGAKVTVVDSAAKLPLLKSLGADHMIDYTVEDFTKNGESYDVIFDVVGKSPYRASLKSLVSGGRYVHANIGLSVMLRGLWTSIVSDKQVLYELAATKRAALVQLSSLIAEGKIKAAIDKVYPLEATADAHRYIESGDKAGHVVLSVGLEQ